MPDGTTIVATLDQRLSTRESRAEDPFTLTVVSPAQYQGARIDGRLLGVDRAGRVAGRADITFDFDRIRFRNGRTSDFDGAIESVRTPDGDTLHVENDGNVGDDESQTSRTATRTGIGAAIGAVIGAVTGGGKGAAIGAAIGGAAGAGSVIVQGRDDLNLEPGSEFTIGRSAALGSSGQVGQVGQVSQVGKTLSPELLAYLAHLTHLASPDSAIDVVVRVGAAGNRPRAGVQVLLDALPLPHDALLQIRRDRRVLLALGAQRVRQHVVALVTLVGQQLVAGRRRERQRNA